MASVKKFQSKNILKRSVNDADKLREKERISSVLKNFNSNSKEKSNDKLKIKKLDNLINSNNNNNSNNHLNFFKNHKFNSSNSNSNNNNNSNVNNTYFSNGIKNSNVSYLEAKNISKGVKLKTNNFKNSFNLNYESQKLLHNNNQNFTNNSQINTSGICNSSNLNFSLKIPKELALNKIQDMSLQNNNPMLYLSTEPEKTDFDFSNLNLNLKEIKELKSSNMTKGNKINNNGNSNVTSVYNNFIRTNPNNNIKILNIMNNSPFVNTNQLFINKLKKASFLSNINNKQFNLSNNLGNNYVNNTDLSLNNNLYPTNNITISNNKKNRNSNNKNNQKPIVNNNLNSSYTKNNNNNANSKLKDNANNIPKNPHSPSPITTYSSPHDFIEDFFKELHKYCCNLDTTEQNQNLNRLNILNIFDNIFKNIITGEKPMETLDIYIKKKLSNYSETWKKFLLAYEKMAIKANADKNPNPNYINNIDLSTKNVINHNHNITTTANEKSCFPENLIAGKHCVQNLKAELEEKFTSLMKTEVNKIKGIVSEKEKIIEELLKEINIKNSYISEMQETLNNFKSKEGLTSHSLLFSDNFLKENLQENNSSTMNKKHMSNNNTDLNNVSTNFNIYSQIKNSNNLNNSSHNIIKIKSNKNLQNVTVPTFSEKKDDNSLNTISNNNLLNAINSEDAQADKSKLDLIDLNNLDFNESNDSISNYNKNKKYNKTKNNNETANKTVENFGGEPADELSLYDQKQFIREKRMLVSENKTLFDKLSEMEKLVNFQKEKEVKLMKVLFFLNKQGIPIDEIIQNQLLSEKSDLDIEHSQIIRESNFTPLESSKSMDSLMYLPLTLEKPNSYTKPEVIPVLNLRDINSKFNMEYGSAKKSNKNKVCITDPSYYNQNNINNFNNYLIEENEDNDDYKNIPNKKFYFENNKKPSNNKAKINKYLKNKNDDITNNQTIQNEFEHKDFMQIVNKCAIKENLRVNKDLSKNLQFRNIKDNMSPILAKNGPEKKSQYFTQELPQKISINNNNNKERTNTKDKINNFSNKNDYENSSISKNNLNNAVWSNHDKTQNNQDPVTNHSNFKISSYNIQKDKNISFNKGFRENKNNISQNQNLTNVSNSYPDNTSQINNPYYINSSVKKNYMNTNINNNKSFMKNSSNINTADNSVIKHYNDKLKLNLNFSVKDKIRNIIIHQQSDNLTKSIEGSFNAKK